MRRRRTQNNGGGEKRRKKLNRKRASISADFSSFCGFLIER
uniref:Uncharacterized protein n=1 Tax=Meloidogyne enterolobii TaxID=390850 RepID=A0A6V7VYZ4_MELEN|nr:unnamed protein product [Meloidogyne enterolobii]